MSLEITSESCVTMKILPRHGSARSAFASVLLALGLHAPGQFIATGVDEGAPPHVKAFSGVNLSESMSFFAYGTGFTGGVRVAVADVNRDMIPDIITAPGGDGAPQVKVFSGADGAEIKSFFAYDPAFTGGVFVAAGDVDGDGFDDIITGTGDGTAGHVKAFRGTDLSVIQSFFAYGPSFTGGVSVAAGDVNGDGYADIITGTASGASHVKAFSGKDGSEFVSFIAYSPGFTGGVFVAGGDVNDDGRADIITGAGPGAGPHVKVFSGATLAEIKSFFAYDVSFTGGVRVAAGDVNGDGRAEVITGTGPGVPGGHVRVFDGITGAQLNSFFAYAPTFTGGVFVGSRAPRVSTRFTVTTQPATNVSFTTATLNGTVNANDGTAKVSFQFGPGADLGSTIAAKPSEVTGKTPTAVSADITGLAPGTTYSFRVVGTDGLGDRVFGELVTFTATINPSPIGGTFAILPAAPVSTGTVLTATFNGWTDGEGHTPLTYEVREGATVIVPAGVESSPTFVLPVGTHQVHGRIYDSLGAFTDTAPVEVVVVGDPESDLVYGTGDPVPGAGSYGIPQDAKWTKFGVPAIDDQGAMVFAGKWESSQGRGGGIYYTERNMLAVTGSLVPGAGTGGSFAIPEGAVFKSFRDPVIDAGGLVAFIATIDGKGVTDSNDTVVVSNARTGALEVIAREGSPAPGTNGAKFRFFNGISVRNAAGQRALIPAQQIGGTLFTARLAGVQSNKNLGAWWLPPGQASAILLVRQGGEGFAPGETIKNFILLQSLPGSPGQGRGQIDADKALLQVTLSSGKQAMVLATPSALENFTQTGDTFGEQGSVWIRMSQPSSGNIGQNLSVLGTFGSTSASPVSRPGVGLLRSMDGGRTWALLAGVGQFAGGNDSIWIDLGHPVQSSTGAGVAFPGKAREGTDRPSEGIWWMPEGGSLKLVAREGIQAAECAQGEKWVAFKSLALPGGATGPLFVGKYRVLRPRSLDLFDTGVWAVDRAGSLRLLFREGKTSIGGKTVKSFDVLKEVSGSPGVTRAFNSYGQVVWRATFTDGTTGIVMTQVP
jgi:REJ domain/FG-GAP-like repeat/FG-GAP repeat